MKLIGGELPVSNDHYATYFTDSGRSSLRLFVRNYKKKKFLIPDFLCETVVRILGVEEIEYDFYHIDESLSADLHSIAFKKYDVLYVINYFGKKDSSFAQLHLDNKIVVQDSVFEILFNNYLQAKNWFGFNSFRKITYLADGSMIKTNLQFDIKIQCKEADFVRMKYTAKEEKWKYVHSKTSIENVYLNGLEVAEQSLNVQNDIYMMSGRSHFLLLESMANYHDEIRRRKENLMILLETMSDIQLFLGADESPFFVISTTKRDELRRYLASKNIFLPVHWPFFGISNELYQTIISIPLFSCYTKSDMHRVAASMAAFFVIEKVGF